MTPVSPHHLFIAGTIEHTAPHQFGRHKTVYSQVRNIADQAGCRDFADNTLMKQTAILQSILLLQIMKFQAVSGGIIGVVVADLFFGKFSRQRFQTVFTA